MKSIAKNVTALAVAALTLGTFAASAQSVKTGIRLAGLPTGIAANYLTNKIYVGVPSFGGPTDTLQVIDGSTDKVVASIAIPPVAVSVATDILTNQVFVGGCTLDTGACSVVQVDGASNKVVANIPVTDTAGLGIESVTVDPILGKVFVSNASDNEIDVITEKSKNITARISTGNNSPFGATVNYFTSKLYVTTGTSQINEYDTKTLQLVGTGNSGATDVTVAVNPFTGHLFVPNNIPSTSYTSVLDRNVAAVTTVKTGNTPYGVDVDLITNIAFVVNSGDNTVSVIDGSSNTVKATLPVSGFLVAVNPFTKKAYVTGQNATVTVVGEK